eukprot:gene4095-5123_t
MKSEKSGFKRKKPEPVKYGKATDNENRIKEIVYDDHDRKDYLTGFSRRKKARREFAQKRVEEKEKLEKAEQKKFAKLQRESFRNNIIEQRKKAEKEMGLIYSEDEEDIIQQDDDEEEDDDNKKKNINKQLLEKKSIEKEFELKKNNGSQNTIIKTTIKPISFDGDLFESINNSKNDDDDDDDEDEEEEEEDGEEEEEEGKEQGQKNKKLNSNIKKSTFKKEKDVITADKLTVFDKEKKIYVDDKGRKVVMKKEKGKFVPVVLTEAAETAMDKGWKLPRNLRDHKKKSWSLLNAKKARRKQKKAKKQR